MLPVLLVSVCIRCGLPRLLLLLIDLYARVEGTTLMTTPSSGEAKTAPATNTPTTVAKLPVSPDDRVELRAMRASDQDEWLDHLHGVFTDPRYYFHCHILHDPHFDRDSIFVVTVNDKIAATVRVYRRQLMVRGTAYHIGGIGEVSTKPEYRGRGYAKQILSHAVKWMALQNITISALQTDDQWPLYHSLGWERAAESFTYIPASLFASPTTTATTADGLHVTPLDIRDVTIQKQLSAIHTSYSIHTWNGVFVRSAEYWSRWIPNHVYQIEPMHLPVRKSFQFWGVTHTTSDTSSDNKTNASSSSFIGYVVTQQLLPKIQHSEPDGVDVWRIAEFGAIESEVKRDGGQSILNSVLRTLVTSLPSESHARTLIKIATPVVLTFKSGYANTKVAESKHLMYRAINSGAASIVTELCDPKRLVFWPLDDF